MANEHIINNSLIITGSVTASGGFSGDGSGLTGITSVSEWDGTRDGNAEITGSFIVSGSNVNVDFTNTTGVSGSFSGSFQGDGSGLTDLQLDNIQASGTNLSGSFSGSFQGDGAGLTNLTIFPYNGNATITGSLIVSSSVIDFSNTTAISGSIFSGSFTGDGSNLTGISAQWNGIRDGNAEITGSFIVSGSQPTIDLLGDTTIDQNIEISNRNQTTDIAIGFQTLPDTTVSRDTLAIGYQAGFSQVSGSSNILIGQCAGYDGIKTLCNIAIGNNALESNTGLDTGGSTNLSLNIAIGNRALRCSTIGFDNLGIGNCALHCNIAGTGNIALGNNAGAGSQGSANVLIGDSTGEGADSFNVMVGHQAGYYANGRCNVLIGYQSGICNEGKNNVAIGKDSGKNSTGISNNNVYIGHQAGPSTEITQSDQLYIGTTSGESPLIRGDFSTGVVTVNTCLKAANISGSFEGDGSGLTGITGEWDGSHEGDASITGSLIVSQSTASATAITIENGHIVLTQVSQSLNFNNDEQAANAGVPLGGLYRSGNLIAIRLT